MATNVENATRIDITAKDLTAQAFSSVERGLKGIGAQAVALGGALGLAAFGTMVKSAIDAADQVNKLSQQTGIAAKEIDKLTIAAKLNDVEASSLVTSFKALSSAMNEAGDPASKQAKMFEALGIATRDARGNMRGLGEMTKDIAEVFSQAADGPEKMAVAVALFGKQGLAMLPVLQNMSDDLQKAAQVQEAFGAISTETARAGDAFNDSLALLGEGIKRTFLPAVDSLGPAMERFATAMASTGKEGSALAPVLSLVFEKILPAAVETVGAIIIATNSLAKSLGNLLGGLAASLVQLSQGNFAQAWDTAKSAWSDSGAIIERSNVAIAALTDRTKAAAPAITSSADAAKKLAAAAQSIVEPSKRAGDSLKHYNEQVAWMQKQAQEELKVGKERLEWFEKVERALDTIYEAEAKNVESINKETEAYQRQIDQLTMTEESLLKKTAAQLADNIAQIEAIAGADDNTEAMRRQIDVINQLIDAKSKDAATKAAADQAKATADEWKRTADSIESSLTDALMRGFEGGKDWAKNFGETLKNMFSTLVLRPVIQGVLAPIAGGAASLFSGGASASGGGGLGSLGGIGNLFGGGALGSGASISMSNIGELGLLEGSLANFSNIAGQLSTGAAGLTSAIGMAMPYIGAAVAVGSLVYNLVRSNKDPAQVKGQFQVGGSGFEDNAFVSSRFGALGFADAGTQQFSGEAGKSFSTIVGKLLDAAADQMTPDQVSRTAEKLTSTIFEGLEGTFTTQDFISKYGADILQQTVSVAFDELNPQLAKLMRGFEGSAEEMGGFAETLLQVSAVVKTAINNVGSSARIVQQLNSLIASIGTEGITTEAVANLRDYAIAMVAVSDSISGSVANEAISKWEEMRRSSVGTVDALALRVSELVDGLDDGASSMVALASATSEYRKAVVDTLVAIENLKTQVADMFGATRDALEIYGLSPEQLYTRYKQDADRAAELLRTAESPEAVAKLAEAINADINKAFSALDDAGKSAQQNPLLEYLASIDEYVQGRFAEIGGAISTNAEDVFGNVNSALDDVATLFDSSATTQQLAADTALEAAKKNEQAAAASEAAANAMGDAVRMFIAQLPIGVTVNMRGSEVNA